MGIIPVVLIVLIAIAWILGIIWAMTTGREHKMLKRSAFWGSLITGFAGLVFAINSILGGEEIGAGVCLFASAVAFGVIALLAIKQ